MYICKDNVGAEDTLTLGKTYKIIRLCRDEVYNVWVFIKNDCQEEAWYSTKRFTLKNRNKK